MSGKGTTRGSPGYAGSGPCLAGGGDDEAHRLQFRRCELVQGSRGPSGFGDAHAPESLRLEHFMFAGVAAVMILAAVTVRLRRKALLHEIRPGSGSRFDTESIQ